MNLPTSLKKARAASHPEHFCRRWRASLLNGALLLLSLAVVSGCATPALWKHTAARNWAPEDSPDQFLATTTTGRQDVIVIFRQSAYVGEKPKYRTVAWNLRLPPSELVIGRHALRQLTNACDRVQGLPSFAHGALPAGAASLSEGYAVTGPLPHHFKVCAEGIPLEPFVLPYSTEKTRMLTRLGVLPFAVAADTALVLALGSAGAGGR